MHPHASSLKPLAAHRRRQRAAVRPMQNGVPGSLTVGFQAVSGLKSAASAHQALIFSAVGHHGP
jgi:hypothetical protein